MGWNNFVEKQKFQREEKELEEYYRQQGVSETDIGIIRKMNRELFNQDRSFYTRNTSLEQNTEDMPEEGQNPLMAQYRYELSEELGVDKEADLWWINQIEDKSLHHAVNGLSIQQKHLLQLAVIEEIPEKGRLLKSQLEIAEKMGLTRQAVNARLQTIYRKCRKLSKGEKR